MSCDPAEGGTVLRVLRSAEGGTVLFILRVLRSRRRRNCFVYFACFAIPPKAELFCVFCDPAEGGTVLFILRVLRSRRRRNCYLFFCPRPRILARVAHRPLPHCLLPVLRSRGRRIRVRYSFPASCAARRQSSCSFASRSLPVNSSGTEHSSEKLPWKPISCKAFR